MDHSYEEMRDVVLDILAGRERVSREPDEYQSLACSVAEVFLRRGEYDAPQKASNYVSPQPAPLSTHDADLFLEIFWGLFREGVITLGRDDRNRDYPHLRVSLFGKRLLESGNAYFFHDVSTYEKLVRDNVPDIDDVTMIYVKEAMQAFRAGCILSATVMLGVATEHTFLLLMETIDQNPAHKATFSSVGNERLILRKVNKFRNIIDGMRAGLPQVVREDLDTHFAGILSVIRTFRNESGHPSGKIIDREQAYVLLHLFVPYCKKMYQLREHFSGT